MARFKVIKKGKTFFARVFTKNGFLLDSQNFRTKLRAQKQISKLKKSNLFSKF